MNVKEKFENFCKYQPLVIAAEIRIRSMNDKRDLDLFYRKGDDFAQYLNTLDIECDFEEFNNNFEDYDGDPDDNQDKTWMSGEVWFEDGSWGSYESSWVAYKRPDIPKR